MLQPVAKITMRIVVLQETPVPGRASRRRRSVHISHSRPAWPFCVGHHSAHNFLVKWTCCILLKPLESQVTPELLSPIYSRSVPARSGVYGARWFQTGNGIPRLKAPSTSSRDVPSLTISVGVPIKPS